MDTPDEYRRIEYDETYKNIFGCYEDEVDWEDLDEDEIKEIKKERIKTVRKRLGWR